ncbi:MAG: hypothetical protein KGL39_23265 [Patescibacteria group bacterium]|nr:hypothetical protein [Patescibacteria group bacterium]
MTTNIFDKMARQGDVLVRRVHAMPQSVKKVDWQKERRVILAYGEVTGHAHALDLSFATMFQTDEGKRFIEVVEGAALSHEEHATVTPEPGIYEVIQQREYTPEAIRNVQD